MAIQFTKMHGLGNDFIIIDQRNSNVAFTSKVIERIAHRQRGVGCDQLIVLNHAQGAAVHMGIFNADGSPAEACGNATRCVAWLEMQSISTKKIDVITSEGTLHCEETSAEMVRVNMGVPKLAWQDIPLSQEHDTLHIPVSSGPLCQPVGVNMGNPHAVFFVDDMERLDLKLHGPRLETHASFPQKVNIGVAQIINPQHIHLRVWERGAGLTQACGTGACAAQVAARRRGLTDSTATVQLPGGQLTISWEGTEGSPNHPVWMEGAVARSFTGILDESLLKA